ncbi:DEAD-box ATP-dependent RNA helicase CshA [Microbacterium esteraromaticum]|uniref:DEAD-box ATP-dependent RNA helicase CshA n=1 Tax=Microbacterium esteraromaticum TaxID=57043 RepID=A0A1R4KQD5_9MICO|nr:DEAD/DEAH box helicase [Microbacterium esteraromaticum]SJN46337.1 DEAD-box ATP-dependent RNA helicase CshA [Microbacterium esteraromaticum]
MPKNGKPKGGRPARNFEPRYAKKTSFHDRHPGGRDGGRPAGRDGRSDAGERRSYSGEGRNFSSEGRSADRRPGSVSPKHRGYRAAESGSDAPKRRWTDQERAGRDESRTIRNRADSGRREAPRHEGRDDRGERRFNDRGERRYDGPRRDDRAGGRGDDRFARGDRNERPRFDRNERGDRPGFNRSDRNDRPRFDRNDRNDRPRFDRNDRNDRPRFDRNDRNDRPRFDRNDRSERPGFNRDDRPRYDRNDRNDRGGRPGFDRNPSDRPRFDRDDRGGRGGFDRGNDRPRFDRNDRPARDDRPRYGDRPRFDRNDRPARDERPRYDRNERPARTERPVREDRAPRQNREDRPSRSDWNRTAAAPAPQHADDVVHERLEAQTVQATEVADVTFADLGLGSNIAEVLRNMGAEKPFPIQAASIPAVLEGRDVLGRGRTGSGKTIAFGAPLVERILKSQAGTRREIGRKPRAIILAPTRELALQIDRTVQPIARSVGLFTTQIYGGVPQARQVGALRKGVDIIIGTPGRIEDLIEQGKLDLSDVRIAVLDEADHMCELGFVEPVQRILRKTADGSQKLLFSATLDREVAALVDEFLVNPAVYEVAGEDQDSGTIEHRVLVIEHRDKAEVLTSLVDRDGQTLVFARTRAYAEMLAEQFEDAGIAAVSLHGDLNQAKRTRNLQKLTAGKVQVLVATDVAARGIHVDDIDLVVQADAPDEYKTYLHRSGRTGRAGRSGRVVTLIPRQRRRRMEDMLQRAEIAAPFELAQPGDDVIDEISGRVPTAAELTA